MPNSPSKAAISPIPIYIYIYQGDKVQDVRGNVFSVPYKPYGSDFV